MQEIASVLARRLPASSLTERESLADAYLKGVASHAVARTTGVGPVPTSLLRMTTTAARAVRKTMLAVYDDLPVLALKAAFAGALVPGLALRRFG